MADGANVIQEVDVLKRACAAAYAGYPNSCSHSVWSVIKALVDPAKEYAQANALIDMLERTWTAVDLATAGKLANQGKVVVGGLKATPNGHVIIVYPGEPKPRGGYSAMRANGTTFVVRSAGLYPRAMSTSIGSWPGAMSNGDKTVWDPWGSDDTFPTVKFWHKDSGAATTATSTAAMPRLALKLANARGSGVA